MMDIRGLEQEHISATICRSRLDKEMAIQPNNMGIRRAYHEALKAERRTGDDYRRAIHALTMICFGELA